MCSFITFQPRFSDPFLRPLRAATFGSLAFSSIIPMIHGIIKYGWELQSQRMDPKWVLITLCLNILGAAAYAIKVLSPKIPSYLPIPSILCCLLYFQFPERWFKRTFDIFGASHQWLHIMVVLAGLTHTMGILRAFDFLHAHPNECIT
jgi:adiponectin receptor